MSSTNHDASFEVVTSPGQFAAVAGSGSGGQISVRKLIKVQWRSAFSAHLSFHIAGTSELLLALALIHFFWLFHFPPAWPISVRKTIHVLRDSSLVSIGRSCAVRSSAFTCPGEMQVWHISFSRLAVVELLPPQAAHSSMLAWRSAIGAAGIAVL